MLALGLHCWLLKEETWDSVALSRIVFPSSVREKDRRPPHPLRSPNAHLLHRTVRSPPHVVALADVKCLLRRWPTRPQRYREDPRRRRRQSSPQARQDTMLSVPPLLHFPPLSSPSASEPPFLGLSSRRIAPLPFSYAYDASRSHDGCLSSSHVLSSFLHSLSLMRPGLERNLQS